VDRILVINLTRMGDIVQSSPLVEGLRQRHPGARIALLVIDVFEEAARMIPGADEVLLWPQNRSVSLLMLDRHTLEDAFLWHRDFVHGLRPGEWDLVINVTHSNDSAVLSRILGGGEVHGLSIHRNGLRNIGHDWVKYFFNVTANRDFNDYNLVDIYRRIGDLGPGEGRRLRLDPGPEAVRVARELIERGLGQRSGNGRPGAGSWSRLVVLQMGANDKNRRWPVCYFHDLARGLHRSHGAVFALVGTDAERRLAEEFLGLARGLPILNLCGETGLRELAAVCAEADLLVSNDTGTMHVAAAQGTLSISLFLATALPAETGPYIEGSIVMQPDVECAPCSHHVVCPHLMCRELITPEAVRHAAALLLGGAAENPAGMGDTASRALAARSHEDWPDGDRVKVWITTRDSAGFQDLRPLNVKPLRHKQVVAWCYRALWRRCLGSGGGTGAPSFEYGDFGKELRAKLEGCLPPEQPEGFEDRFLGYRDVFSETAELARRGREWTERVGDELSAATPSTEVLLAASEGVTGIDERIFRLEMSHGFLRPIAVLFRFDKDGLDPEAETGSLNRRMERIYRELEQRARGMHALLGEAAEACRRWLPIEERIDA